MYRYGMALTVSGAAPVLEVLGQHGVGGSILGLHFAPQLPRLRRHVALLQLLPQPRLGAQLRLQTRLALQNKKTTHIAYTDTQPRPASKKGGGDRRLNNLYIFPTRLHTSEISAFKSKSGLRQSPRTFTGLPQPHHRYRALPPTRPSRFTMRQPSINVSVVYWHRYDVTLVRL